VYFDASRELASIHLNSRAMTIVASPKTAPGSLSVPALAEDYRTFWSADYRERGYCYIFSDSQERPSPKPPPGILVIIDSDRDGSVDKSVLVSGEQWSSDGWGKHENVVPSSRGL
jgi:hypothetical protein